MRYPLFITVLFTLCLSACGGGGSGAPATTETPVAEDPVTEDPVTEDPVTEDPVTEDPVTEDPVTEEIPVPDADTGTGTSPTTLSVPVPVALSQSLIPAAGTGVPSAERATSGFGQATFTLPSSITVSASINPAAVATVVSDAQVLPTTHIEDTGAASQWTQGWTGLGTSIAVIDDFQTEDIAVAGPEFTVRQFVNGQAYDVSYRVEFNASHGYLTANIAGGGEGVTTTKTVTLNALRASCAQHSCDGFSVNNLDQNNFDMTWKTAGIAKEASIVQAPVSPNRNGFYSINSLFNAVDLNRQKDVINVSFGSELSDGLTLEAFKNQIGSSFLSGDLDAALVVSAGNSGASCASTNLHLCSGLSSELALLPSTGQNTVIAGATSGTGTSEKIADYSNRAGAFAQRYLMAPGTTGFIDPDSGGEIVGTSFAAPRIAGAAALLRHKFSNLSGAQAASILLLTGNKDINNDGVEDFSGVSEIYGHGKLFLERAMSPIGSLAAP